MFAVCRVFGERIVPATGMASGLPRHLVNSKVAATTEYSQVGPIEDAVRRQAPLDDVIDVERSVPSAAVLTGQVAARLFSLGEERPAHSLPGPATAPDAV